ncbi:hypothetical protein EXIGLDRAFT_744928 [Exidia glandulosa HHB12029]|uniref:Uncharacterized protein n=1 Tax=Exidia glandulosa HHB12029 TaxID=1314781 RepID=A0A165PA89_EXIGL|nr:hypothetical protein EXIGLDRAFT_744928 [Exidia glandulosa HHB12029]
MRSSKEPILIFINSPSIDHQAIREASYVNILVIAPCDTDVRTRSRRRLRNCRRGLAAAAAVDYVTAPDSWDANGAGTGITAAATCGLDWKTDTGAAGGEWGVEPVPRCRLAASGDRGLGKGAKTCRDALCSSWVIRVRLHESMIRRATTAGVDFLHLCDHSIDRKS